MRLGAAGGRGQAGLVARGCARVEFGLSRLRFIGDRCRPAQHV